MVGTEICKEEKTFACKGGKGGEWRERKWTWIGPWKTFIKTTNWSTQRPAHACKSTKISSLLPWKSRRLVNNSVGSSHRIQSLKVDCANPNMFR